MALFNSNLLEPNLILGKTILHLSPEIIRHHRLKGLILDVDDTLVSMRQSYASDDVLEWVTQVRRVADIWLVSNNLSQKTDWADCRVPGVTLFVRGEKTISEKAP